MKYRKLGRTGLEVSDIAHGLWGMSGWTGSEDEQSRHAIQMAMDLGCNFFDTAWAYGNGKSDALLGEAMQGNSGKRIYAASKIPPKNLQWPALSKYKYSDVFPPDHVFASVPGGSADTTNPPRISSVPPTSQKGGSSSKLRPPYGLDAIFVSRGWECLCKVQAQPVGIATTASKLKSPVNTAPGCSAMSPGVSV